MPKTLGIRLEDYDYEQFMEYSKARNSNLAGMCRRIIEEGFLKMLEDDEINLARAQRILNSNDPNSPDFDEISFKHSPLSNQEKADMEKLIKILEPRLVKFKDLRDNLCAEIYGGDNA